MLRCALHKKVYKNLQVKYPTHKYSNKNCLLLNKLVHVNAHITYSDGVVYALNPLKYYTMLYTITHIKTGTNVAFRFSENGLVLHTIASSEVNHFC